MNQTRHLYSWVEAIPIPTRQYFTKPSKWLDPNNSTRKTLSRPTRYTNPQLSIVAFQPNLFNAYQRSRCRNDKSQQRRLPPLLHTFASCAGFFCSTLLSSTTLTAFFCRHNAQRKVGHLQVEVVEQRVVADNAGGGQGLDNLLVAGLQHRPDAKERDRI